MLSDLQVLLPDDFLQSVDLLLQRVDINAFLVFDLSDDVRLHLAYLLPQCQEVVLDRLRVRRKHVQHLFDLVAHLGAHTRADFLLHFNEKVLNITGLAIHGKLPLHLD